MERPFLPRLSGAVVALVLGITTLVAIVAAAPANAAGGTCPTTASLSLRPGHAGYKPAPYYGQSLYLDGDVTYTCPSDPTYHVNAGTVYLERNTGAGWVRIASFADGWPYLSTTYTARASYRITYTGATNAYGEVLPAVASSNVVATGTVYRSLAGSTSRIKGRKAIFNIKISPAASGRFALQVKRGKRWKKVRKVRVRDGHVRITVAVPRRGKTTYRLMLPAAGTFPAQPVPFWVKRL